MEQIARTPSLIGNAIRRHRRSLGLIQSTVGEKTKLRQATVSAVERGEPGTQLRTVCDLLAALGLEFVIRPRSTASADEIEGFF